MENYLKGMRSHLDEVATAASIIMREANGYVEKIKELKPLAEGLEKQVEEIRIKRAELVDIETRLASARKSLKDIRDSLK